MEWDDGMFEALAMNDSMPSAPSLHTAQGALSLIDPAAGSSAPPPSTARRQAQPSTHASTHPLRRRPSSEDVFSTYAHRDCFDLCASNGKCIVKPKDGLMKPEFENFVLSMMREYITTMDLAYEAEALPSPCSSDDDDDDEWEELPDTVTQHLCELKTQLTLAEAAAAKVKNALSASAWRVSELAVLCGKVGYVSVIVVKGNLTDKIWLLGLERDYCDCDSAQRDLRHIMLAQADAAPNVFKYKNKALEQQGRPACSTGAFLVLNPYHARRFYDIKAAFGVALQSKHMVVSLEYRPLVESLLIAKPPGGGRTAFMRRRAGNVDEEMIVHMDMQ